MSEHDWKCVEVGNWYSEYECQKCREHYVLAPEDSKIALPSEGCNTLGVMSKVQITADQLCSLGRHSIQVGTFSAFLDLCCDWVLAADAAILRQEALIKKQDTKIERLRKLVELGYREGWTNAFNEIGRDPFRPEECDTWADSLTRKALEDE